MFLRVLTVGMVILAAYLYYVRQQQLSARRTISANNDTIGYASGAHHANLTFVLRANETNAREVKTRFMISAKGDCGSHIEPTKRPCTPRKICYISNMIAYHWHEHLVEHFHVVQGQMAAKVDGVVKIINAGETIDIPEGIHHTFWLSGDRDMVIDQSVTSDVEHINEAHDNYFENLFGTVRDGTHPIGLLYVVVNHDNHLSAPKWVDALLKIVIDAIAPALGFKTHYPEYTTNCDTIPACKRYL